MLQCLQDDPRWHCGVDPRARQPSSHPECRFHLIGIVSVDLRIASPQLLPSSRPRSQIGVAMAPASINRTLILNGASSARNELHSPARPCLAAPYPPSIGPESLPPMAVTTTAGCGTAQLRAFLAKVSHLLGSPVLKPWASHSRRIAAEPWVHVSGDTWPCIFC